MSDVTPPPAPQSAPNPYAAPAAPNPYASAPAAAVKPSPILSIISVIAGIVSFIGGFIVFIPIVGSVLHLFIPLAAVILGFMGKKKEPAAKGLWLTGIVLGFIGLAVAIISLVVWIGLFATAGVSSFDTNF